MSAVRQAGAFAGLDRAMHLLAKGLALLGGFVLLGLIATTTLSIIGRLLDGLGHAAPLETYLPIVADALKALGPITGDFELVEAGVAFAIMASIPWCQLNRGHAKVEVLTAFLPATMNRWLALIWELVFAAIYALLAWRLIVGTGDKMRYGETSFMLQFPVWWGYAAVAAAACVATLVACWSVVLHARDLRFPAVAT